MKSLRILLPLAALMLVCSCGSKPSQEVHFKRFDQLIFDTPPAQLASALQAEAANYRTPLLNVAPADPAYMEALHAYVSDPVARRVYKQTDSLYHDLGWLEADLGKALARVPEVHYKGFYTLVDGSADNYDNRVFASQDELVLVVDHYAEGEVSTHYGSPLPSYLMRLCKRQYMLPDCMAAIAHQHIALPDAELSLLDYMIAEGRTLYFMRQALPKTHDTLLLRYSAQQLDWMEHHVEHVWSWILQADLLFSTDFNTFHNLVDEAPKTNAFGEGSAPRTVSYIGWQIVNEYMRRSGASLADLLAATDSRRILNESGWRP